VNLGIAHLTRMSLVAHLLIPLFASALVFTGCKHPPLTAQPTVPNSQLEGPRLSSAEAVSLAKRAAERQGLRLREYEEPEAHYEFTRKDRSWWVFFNGRIPMHGNHFAISVDDQTGATRLIPGR
jgi:hypothetical protein